MLDKNGSDLEFAVYNVLLGCEKLGISANGCKVLDKNGSDIDDDETLQAYDDCLLMILQPGENWSSASEENEQTTEQTTQVEDEGSHSAHTSYFGAHHKNMKQDRPILSVGEYSPGILVSS